MDSSGEVVRTQRFADAIYATINGDNMELTIYEPQTGGKGIKVSQFTGKRIPPLPPKPNLKKVKYGKPIALFDGKNLDQWKILLLPHGTFEAQIAVGLSSSKPKE